MVSPWYCWTIKHEINTYAVHLAVGFNRKCPRVIGLCHGLSEGQLGTIQSTAFGWVVGHLQKERKRVCIIIDPDP